MDKGKVKKEKRFQEIQEYPPPTAAYTVSNYYAILIYTTIHRNNLTIIFQACSLSKKLKVFSD